MPETKRKSRVHTKKSAGTGGGRTAAYIVLSVFVLAGFVIAIANYRFPDFHKPEFQKNIAGDAFAAVLIDIGEEINTAWLPNDLFWPSAFLDNPSNYQLGELEVLRYSTRVLRDNLTRLRTTDLIDKDADMAYTSYANDPLRWALPSAESKLKLAVKHMTSFRERLKSGQAHFYPRADNLIELLGQYNSLLGGVCTRLSTIPGDYNDFLTEETAGDEFTEGERPVRVEIPWTEIDDQFYYAQGVAFGLRQALLSVQVDFKDILRMKRADELLSNIIRILEHTQWEPKYLVMNCTPGSWFPCQNDPMMLNSRLQDARQKIGSLVSMMQN